MQALRSITKRLEKLFKPLDQEQELPEKINNALCTGDLTVVSAWLRHEVPPEHAPELITLLQPAARKAGWSDASLGKLQVFVDYHLGDFKRAYEGASRYIDDPDFDADAFIIALLSLYHGNQFQIAYHLQKQAQGRMAQLENRVDFLTVAGLNYISNNDYKNALACMERGLALEPDNLALLFNLYAMYFELGEIEKFEKTKKAIEEKNYFYSEAALAVAYVELAQNKYKQGFRMLEQRYDMVGFKKYLNSALLKHPRWKGDPLQDKALLVTSEQGLGDTVMMARYFKDVGKLAGTVYIECQFEVLSLLTHNFPGIPMVATKYGEMNVKDFDTWVASLSLPYIFSSTCENIPGKTGYLSVPPDYSTYWHDRIEELGNSARPKIGIAWSGQPNHAADKRRSLTTEMLFPLLQSLPHLDFFALQLKVPRERPTNLIDISEELATLADTAAIIDQMDLVITIDTSLVHLAGALGKPTWLLLPHRYEWRWGTDGEKNCWYDSVRVIRQPSPGSWAPLLSRVFCRELPRLFAPDIRKAA